MRFNGLDLNLLVVFDALMQTRSVSRVAEQLNLSQPAISSALRRLRDYFADEILVPHGKRMLPTAHAESLWPQVRESLRTIEGLIATSTVFDPATSQRKFRLCGSDYMATALFVPLARDLAVEAPHVQLEFLLGDERSWAQLEQGAIDLVITPEDYITRNNPAEHLFDERHVVVGWDRNPLLAAPLDEAGFLSAGHVQVAIGSARTLVFADRQLELMGKTRRIEVIVSTFTVVPWLLVETQRLALMHERLARFMARHHPLTVVPCPIALPPMREMLQFHAARAADPGLIWLRGRIHEQAARQL